MRSFLGCVRVSCFISGVEVVEDESGEKERNCGQQCWCAALLLAFQNPLLEGACTEGGHGQARLVPARRLLSPTVTSAGHCWPQECPTWARTVCFPWKVELCPWCCCPACLGTAGLWAGIF